MLVSPDKLPTHLARVANRLNTTGPSASGDTFLVASYLAEATIKTIVLALLAPLRLHQQDEAYSIAHALIRADGLGSWDEKLRRLTSGALAAYTPRDLHSLLAWLTKKRSPAKDLWFTECLSYIKEIRQLLTLEPVEQNRSPIVVNLVSDLVLLRNKTKAHGAVGPDFFEAANTPYVNLLRTLIESCPISDLHWLHLSTRLGRGTARAVLLRGSNSAYVPDHRASCYTPSEPGIYVGNPASNKVYYLGDLLRSNFECSEFYLPNGSRKGDKAEFIDYASGRVTAFEVASFSRPPAPLPPSETEGLGELDLFSNVFGNLPGQPEDYVSRPILESELTSRLRDRNHPIVTLHGRGGVGKTSLALRVAHSLAREEETRFSSIAWFSARDVDLTLSGPKSVRNPLPDLHSISKAFGSMFEMFGTGTTEQDLALCLRDPPEDLKKGILFIFDNFETVDAARDVHRFLDTHTHPPNKVLITSRERAFKGDYPIEVRGMERDEAEQLLTITARRLGIETLLTPQRIDRIYQQTDGHAYVMKLIIGEMAKEKSYVAPKTLLPRRTDIVAAVFERSFNKLSESGRRVFLAACRWRSGISELSLLVILGERGLDVESGIEECVLLSLLNTGELADGQRYYVAPELARVYGQKKFESDPDRLIIQQDVDQLQSFGLLSLRAPKLASQREIVERFVESMMTPAPAAPAEDLERRDRLLTRLAEVWPTAWRAVFEFRKRWLRDTSHAGQALRRLVEEFPSDKGAWLLRARFAEESGDQQTHVSSLVGAADAAPGDVELLREVALRLCQFMDAHTSSIPLQRRGIYLAGVRSHLEAVHEELDATGLSRLAWLFLLEDNKASAFKYASMGLEKDPSNIHCQRLVDRLRRDGF